MNIKPEALLLIGPTGAGKTPLAQFLCGKGNGGPRYHHFDFGEELRRVADVGLSTGYDEGEVSFVRRVLGEGVLLENEHFGLARKMFSLFLDRERYVVGDRVILNGLPRHQGQARDMEDMVHVSMLLVLVATPEEIHHRIRLNTGGDRTSRTDDAPDMIRKKLEIFKARTAPLVAHYEEFGARVLRLAVDRQTRPEDTHRALQAWLSETST